MNGLELCPSDKSAMSTLNLLNKLPL
uniref:Uncharacterized protein n=1 Tax=Anguilla anguilla TaxID=7936 RepID=A0A0E9UI01_ANGAN